MIISEKFYHPEPTRETVIANGKSWSGEYMGPEDSIEEVVDIDGQSYTLAFEVVPEGRHRGIEVGFSLTDAWGLSGQEQISNRGLKAMNQLQQKLASHTMKAMQALHSSILVVKGYYSHETLNEPYVQAVNSLLPPHIHELHQALQGKLLRHEDHLYQFGAAGIRHQCPREHIDEILEPSVFFDLTRYYEENQNRYNGIVSSIFGLITAHAPELMKQAEHMVQDSPLTKNDLYSKKKGEQRDMAYLRLIRQSLGDRGIIIDRGGHYAVYVDPTLLEPSSQMDALSQSG